MLTKVRPVIGRPIPLGRQGEHLARRIDFGDIVEVFAGLYGEGVGSLRYQRPGDSTAYEPARVNTSDGGLVWLPTETDTAQDGRGRVELRWLVNGHYAKSRVWETLVEKSIVEDGDRPGGDDDRDYYEGAYVVTPAWATQTLETTEKIMSQNVVVLDIPVSEVGNEAGGLTLTI